MNNNYNKYNDNDITRFGIHNSFKQNQIKATDLIVQNDMLMNSTNKREGYEKTNKVIDNMNEEILKLNNRVNELLLNLNDYDSIKKENKEYQENISSLQIELNNYKIKYDNIKLEISKLKSLVYEKYNNDKYLCCRYISNDTKTPFDIVHIIMNQLNISSINKGTINILIDAIEKYKNIEKEVKIN